MKCKQFRKTVAISGNIWHSPTSPAVPTLSSKYQQSTAISGYFRVFSGNCLLAITRKLQQSPASFCNLWQMLTIDCRHFYYHLCHYLPGNGCTWGYGAMLKYAGVCQNTLKINRVIICPGSCGRLPEVIGGYRHFIDVCRCLLEYSGN